MDVTIDGAAKSAALGAMDGVTFMAAPCVMEGGTPGPAGIKDDGGADGVAADVGVESLRRALQVAWWRGSRRRSVRCMQHLR